MTTFLVVWSTMASLIATTIMSYICMATPIGPWIETTIVLIGSIIVHIFFETAATRTKILGLSTAAAGMGGIIATACGFSFPTLFFLQPEIFNAWLNQPLYFCAVMAGLVIAASSLGLLIAHIVESKMLAEPSMTFSIGQLTQKMIVAQNQIKKAYELIAGVMTSCMLAFGQSIVHIIPESIPIIPDITFGFITIQQIAFKFDLLPMFLAIGFITGKMLAVPLIVGVFAKFFLLEPLHTFAFSSTSYNNFMLAFFSGMVVQGACMSFMDFPALIRTAWNQLKQKSFSWASHRTILHNVPWHAILTASCCIIPFLWYFKFSLVAQMYIIIGSILCAYQLIIIAGKIGLAPLGRFATFVMVPGLLIFGFTAIQATIVATFVEISGGVAVDALFGRKMGQLAHIKRNHIVWYQILGILVSAMSIGIIFWLLINHFGLQSSELFAQRAQSRAILINAYHFDYCIMLIGALFGFILKYCKVNPVLVLGGLAMSIDVSLMLVIGGLMASLLTSPKLHRAGLQDPEEYYSFWSGIFATSSIIMILKTIF